MSSIVPEDKDMLVTVENADYGKFSIFKPIPDQPVLWHGPYQTGKLTIYSCPVYGEILKPIQALVFVFTDETQPQLDGMGYYLYDAADSIGTCVAALLEHLKISYIAQTMEDKNEQLGNGNSTLH